MSEAQARAWWADVEHLREAAERRQKLEAPRLRAVPADARAAAQPEAVRRRPVRPQPPRRVSGPSRRTVEITGRTVPAPAVPRLVEIERRRPPRSAIERVGPRPDRIAMWAPMLGFLLLLVALISAS